MSLDDIRIVLIEPAHPGNIGAVARAMKTMSLRHLVLVRPKIFPSDEADRRAMGAVDLLEEAWVVNTLEEAIGDCRLVVGCSARTRSVPHALLDPRECAEKVVLESVTDSPTAVLFGTERTGLANEDLDHCTAQVMIPANPEFSSLNLASAVQLVCYEIFMATREPPEQQERSLSDLPSPDREMEYFFEHMFRALDSRNFIDGQMREVAIMKLRRMFARVRPNDGELKMLRSMMRLIHRDGE